MIYIQTQFGDMLIINENCKISLEWNAPPYQIKSFNGRVDDFLEYLENAKTKNRDDETKVLLYGLDSKGCSTTLGYYKTRNRAHEVLDHILGELEKGRKVIRFPDK